MPGHESGEESKRDDKAILSAIAALRDEVMARLATQDMNIAAGTELASVTSTKVGNMEKVLVGPLKFVSATQGVLSFAQMMGGLAVWIAKVAAAVGIVWAVWKYAIMEAIKSAGK